MRYFPTRLTIWCLFACVVCSWLLAPAQIHAQSIPAGFSETTLATLNRPVALAFTPDGRLLVTIQSGQVRLIQNDVLVPTPVLNLASVICTGFERGLVGMTVDPDFATNNYIYVYYTFKGASDCSLTSVPPAFNRLSRFTLPPTNVISLASEVVLLDNIRADGGNHNGGDLHFGPDNLLYISTGDASVEALARDPTALSGKILRIDPKQPQVIPPNNPHANTVGMRICGDPAGVPPGNGPCGEVIAQGFRNPFRFDINPANGQLYINEVGAGTWEEINLWDPSSTSVIDYGWPVREGNCVRGSRIDCGPPPAGLTNPLYAYDHNTGCAAITGSVFVPNGVWPSSFDNSYLFGDYVCGRIYQMFPNQSVNINEPFVSDLGRNSVVTMIFGPHNATQALYYTTISGKVNRLESTSDNNRQPIAQITATPSTGPAPLNVQFSSLGSNDPDGDPLTYDWNFGNGQILTNSVELSPTVIYSRGGVYTATLVVRDNRNGVSQTASVRIDVDNSPPVPQILTPTLTQRFTVGETLTLTGRATDPEDGVLTDTKLIWEVRQHHLDVRYPDNQHFHPWLAPTTGNNISTIAPAPEELFATPSYLEILLTATDSLGRSTTITQTIRPQQAALTIRTEPEGMELIVNKYALTETTVISAWVNDQLTLTALPQVRNGQTWIFDSWADSSPSNVISATRTLTTTTQAMTYTARFRPLLRVYLPFAARNGTAIAGAQRNQSFAMTFNEPASASRWVCQLPGMAAATRPVLAQAMLTRPDQQRE
jgi:glucose/arabinose dehydrogenase/PKD repeat protein